MTANNTLQDAVQQWAGISERINTLETEGGQLITRASSMYQLPVVAHVVVISVDVETAVH